MKRNHVGVVIFLDSQVIDMVYGDDRTCRKKRKKPHRLSYSGNYEPPALHHTVK